MACLLLVVGLALFGASCGDSSDPADRTRQTRSPEAHDFADVGARIDDCPSVITGSSHRSRCKMAYEILDARPCGSFGPGGGDVSAVGVSCALARQLRVPVGHGPVEPNVPTPRGVGEKLYRPWVADGPYTSPRPIRPIGWTCFNHVEGNGGAGIRHLCWNEDGGVVLFTFH